MWCLMMRSGPVWIEESDMETSAVEATRELQSIKDQMRQLVTRLHEWNKDWNEDCVADVANAMLEFCELE